jgi:hypothetical protein
MTKPSVTFVLGGLIVAVLSTGTAVAATGAVTIADPSHPSHKAHVSSTGALSVAGKVGINGTVSVAGSVAVHGGVTASESPPSSFVRAFANTALTCMDGNVYTVPAGKELIVTSFVFTLHNTGGAGAETAMVVYSGAPAGTCDTVLAQYNTTDAVSTAQQTFQPGIAVPAGQSVKFVETNGTGSMSMYGYLVPA